MKKYIQPTSETLALQPESVIALSIKDQGTDSNPLSNQKNGWNCEDWSNCTEEEY